MQFRIIAQFICLLLPGLALAQFYHPDHKNYGSPTDYGLEFSEVYFDSQDGTKLHGWHVRTSSNLRRATIIHMHGNAQNMTAHLGGVAWLANSGFDLFLFDYRGFGKSDGRPNQIGVFEDCVAAIRKVQALSPDETKFIVYGQSLGAANAIAVMGEVDFPNIVGVVAEASFYSYRSIARDKVNGFLDNFVSVVVEDAKSPYLVIHEISPTPLLLVHGTADRVVPYKHSEALFRLAKEPKELWTVRHARHLSIFQNSRDQKELVKRMDLWLRN